MPWYVCTHTDAPDFIPTSLVINIILVFIEGEKYIYIYLYSILLHDYSVCSFYPSFRITKTFLFTTAMFFPPCFSLPRVLSKPKPILRLKHSRPCNSLPNFTNLEITFLIVLERFAMFSRNTRKFLFRCSFYTSVDTFTSSLWSHSADSAAQRDFYKTRIVLKYSLGHGFLCNLVLLATATAKLIKVEACQQNAILCYFTSAPNPLVFTL